MTTGAKWAGALTVVAVGIFFLVSAGRVAASDGVTYDCPSTWRMLTSDDRVTRADGKPMRGTPSGTFRQCRNKGMIMAVLGTAAAATGVIVTGVIQTRRRSEDIDWFASFDPELRDGHDR